MAPSNPPSDLRYILIVVTTGGFTHARPLLEFDRILHERVHTISLFTLSGQSSWADPYPFISRVYTCGTGPSTEQLDAHCKRDCAWRPKDGIASLMESKRLFDSFWPQTYRRLRDLCGGEKKKDEGKGTHDDGKRDKDKEEEEKEEEENNGHGHGSGERDEQRRPNFILADFFATDAATDMQTEFRIPVGIMWPQMPYLIGGASYIPDQSGFLCIVNPSSISSETASFSSRIKDSTVLLWGLPFLISWLRWSNNTRRKEGVRYPKMTGETRPRYLVLVNTFWGLELPRKVEPLIQPVGPVLSEEWSDLDELHEGFLRRRKKVLYVALGTHGFLPKPRASMLLWGLLRAVEDGTVDGVIWSLNQRARDKFDLENNIVMKGGEMSAAQIFEGNHPNFLVLHFCPQRAIPAHPPTTLFLTHGGSSSTNEAAFHGVKVLCLPFFFDQLSYAARLERAGVGLSLDKFAFTSEEVAEKVRMLVEDEDGRFGIHVERLKNIARTASRRKFLGADLVEEMMWDWEGRRKMEDAGYGGIRGTLGTRLPPHLEAADSRMAWWKARNLDLAAFLAVVLGTGCFGVVWGARFVWNHEGESLRFLRDVSMKRGTN